MVKQPFSNVFFFPDSEPVHWIVHRVIKEAASLVLSTRTKIRRNEQTKNCLNMWINGACLRTYYIENVLEYGFHCATNDPDTQSQTRDSVTFWKNNQINSNGSESFPSLSFSLGLNDPACVRKIVFMAQF